MPAIIDSIPDSLRAEYEEKVLPHFGAELESAEGAGRICSRLRKHSLAGQSFSPDVQRLWELCGLFYINTGRWHEAIVIFHDLYDSMLTWEVDSVAREHKGMPLCWLSDCYSAIGCPVLARRYLMLTTCEDAIREQGDIRSDRSGVYFRWVMRYGLSPYDLSRYAREIWRLYHQNKEEARFPEWIVQDLDHLWITAFPSTAEVIRYDISSAYAVWLFEQLGKGDGKFLERLAHYLLSAIPGCRAYRPQRSHSTDYDVVCAFEGANVDFRGDLGRYFICECKDWEKPADFSAFAKFCRVLDAAKCGFGIIFSKKGISGEGRTVFAEREQLKVFQDRGLVIVVISEDDLSKVITGSNFVTMLREKYENIRLDLKRLPN